MAFEAIIIGVAVVIAGMVLARHLRTETSGKGGSCADCCERCAHRSQCALVVLKAGTRKGEKPSDDRG